MGKDKQRRRRHDGGRPNPQLPVLVPPGSTTVPVDRDGDQNFVEINGGS
jgi:hypothetical protein